MIILIPLGGIGSRFKLNNDNDLTNPKALISVNNKPIIFWLIDNLELNKNKVDFVYIPYNKEYKNFRLEERLIEAYPNINFKFLCLQENTKGAAETILIALQNLNNNQNDCPILCIDSDNFYTTDIISQWNNENTVFTFSDKNPNPLFSYIENENNVIKNIVEKEKISNNACCGAYGFDSFKTLQKYIKLVISENFLQKGEFYTSNVIKRMIQDSFIFKDKNIENKNYFSLGTPEQVKQFNYTFLFDLDGTLVKTDHIYTKVWNALLQKYNITVDTKFFNDFIKGKSDVNFLKYLIPNIQNEEIKSISKQKDLLFIEIIKKENHILIENVLNFFEKIKNSRIAIVTSCNYESAKFILENTGLNNYVNLLISSENCINHKPHPEPYNLAITKLNVNKNRCLIFEDSMTGYLSAKNSNVFKVCIFTNNDSSDEILDLDEYKFSDYNQLDLNELLEKKEDISKNDKSKHVNMIKDKLSYLPIRDINYNNKNIKTGYICDIDSYKITYNNDDIQNIILKISNFENELSKTAVKLNMYKNEAYFYENISSIISDISLPKSFGVIIDDKKHGILLEDLKIYNGHFNINLNKDIDLLLKVVNKIFNLHNKFYFIDESKVICSMKKVMTINKVNYYNDLVQNRFDKFYQKNQLFMSDTIKTKVIKIKEKFSKILGLLSQFPLSFCHGDLKSPNIFYRNDSEPYFLDWQYIQLNKGVSDIVFLLVESLDYDETITNIVEKYYYKLNNQKRNNYTYDEYLNEFKLALCAFPFFVTVWFNSEDSDKLIDKSFPIKFMKNLFKYYDNYLSDSFLMNI